MTKSYVTRIITKEEYNYELVRSYCKYPDNGCCTYPDTITGECNLSGCSWLK